MSGILAWITQRKGMVVAVVAIALYVGGLNLRLHFVKVARDKAKAELILAKEANRSNLETIGALGTANKAWADAAKLNAETAKKLKDKANEAQRNADRARNELARLRELDRRAPDCAALLDRSLAACPDLVKRLWPLK